PLPATETSGKTDESTPAEASRKRDLNTSQSKSTKMPRKLPATPVTTVESKIPRRIETMPSISPEEMALPLLLDTPPDSTHKSSNKRKARTAMVTSNKPSFPMDHSNNEMDQLLQVIDTSKVPGYQEFMHVLIVEDISNHDLNFETLNSFLFEWNKQVYDAVCEKAISYYDTYATEKIKSLGN
ncbi:unnamed protein product, partial [Porites evermanni]